LSSQLIFNLFSFYFSFSFCCWFVSVGHLPFDNPSGCTLPLIFIFSSVNFLTPRFEILTTFCAACTLPNSSFFFSLNSFYVLQLTPPLCPPLRFLAPFFGPHVFRGLLPDSLDSVFPKFNPISALSSHPPNLWAHPAFLFVLQVCSLFLLSCLGWFQLAFRTFGASRPSPFLEPEGFLENTTSVFSRFFPSSSLCVAMSLSSLLVRITFFSSDL